MRKSCAGKVKWTTTAPGDEKFVGVTGKKGKQENLEILPELDLKLDKETKKTLQCRLKNRKKLLKSEFRFGEYHILPP